MQFLLDHATATVISGMLVLIVFVIQLRLQERIVEKTLMNATRTHTLAVADVLERDLINAGYERNPQYDQRIITYSTDEAFGTQYTDVFAFWGMDAAGNSMPIKYEVEKVDSTIIREVLMPLFEWSRYVCTNLNTSDVCTTWKSSGMSRPTLTRFEIEMIDDSGNAIPEGDPEADEASTLTVWMTDAVNPHIGGGSYASEIPLLYWRITLQPGGLRKS